jgi:hypothetical protein
MRRIWLLTVLMMFLHGCVKETTWTSKGELPVKLVVDAILTDEVKAQAIRLTFPVPELNQAPEPVAGASVLISNDDSTWQLTESTVKPGTYNTPPYFYARLQKTYTLLISLNGRVYSAKASMVPGTAFGELQYVKDDGTGLYRVDWVANAFSTEEAAMWELLVDWSRVPGYAHLDSLETHARMLFYTLPTLDVSEVFAPMMQTVLFPAGTSITERRYSISPEHAEFVREMLMETNWAGGLFPTAPANVGTNISSGAFGFFGVCAVTELAVVITP